MTVAERRELACEELVELVTDYVEGALPAADVDRFDAHIAKCDGCQMYLDQMRATIEALGHLPLESLSPQLERDLVAAFRGWRDGR